MRTIEIWAIILGGMVATYAVRLSFISLFSHERLPSILRRGLRYVPPAVLAAIILPALVMPDGDIDITLGNHRLIAGTLAALLAWRTRNSWLTIGVGMVALWIMSTQ